MRSSLFKRLGLRVGCALALWILGAPALDAAPLAKPSTRVARATWESRPASRRVRTHIGLDRPRPRDVHYSSLLRKQRPLFRHVTTTWLERRHTTPFRDNNEEALQNSTAALGDQDDLLLASLEPIGILVAQPFRIPINGVVTPRSPRGPPTRLA